MAIKENDEVLSLITYLVSNISLGSFGEKGEKFVDEAVCVWRGGRGDNGGCNPSVRFDCQRLMLISSG